MFDTTTERSSKDWEMNMTVLASRDKSHLRRYFENDIDAKHENIMSMALQLKTDTSS